jgi:hypothetical protein
MEGFYGKAALSELVPVVEADMRARDERRARPPVDMCSPRPLRQAAKFAAPEGSEFLQEALRQAYTELARKERQDAVRAEVEARRRRQRVLQASAEHAREDSTSTTLQRRIRGGKAAKTVRRLAEEVWEEDHLLDSSDDDIPQRAKA